MSTPTWLEEAAAAGVRIGARVVLMLEYSGGGQVGTVEAMRDGIVFLDHDRRIRWAAVIGVRDPTD